MLFVQTYYSISEIDKEFIPALDELLKREELTTAQLESFEFKEEKETVFLYHLFFCSEHNNPIGIFLLQLVPVAPAFYLPFFKSILPKNKKAYALIAELPSLNHASFLFYPQYQSEGERYIGDIIKAIRSKRQIVAETWNFLTPNSEIEFKINASSLHLNHEKITNFKLEHRFSSYESYIENLAPEVQHFLKNVWKNIYRNPDLELTENELENSQLQLCILENGKSWGSINLKKMSNGRYLLSMPRNAIEKGDLGLWLQLGIMNFLELSEAKELIFKKEELAQVIDTQDIDLFKITPITTDFSLYSSYELPEKSIESLLSRF